MKGTITIMTYHHNKMIEILNNLTVWDWEAKTNHEGCIIYTYEKKHNLKQHWSVFKITAIKHPCLTFLSLGKRIEREDNNLLIGNSPTPIIGNKKITWKEGELIITEE